MNDNEQLLEGLKKVLKIAKANGNQLFIENIERDIEALEAGKESPIIKKYLTAEERSEKTIQTKKIRRANFQQDP
jgi:hypothetical protein